MHPTTPQLQTVAALFVLPDGPYSRLPGIDLWDERRDARQYAGPHPVVAHPPCQRWGRYATIGGRKLGDDGGCGTAAVAAVRRFGGVLEHPASSRLWDHCQLPWPGGLDKYGGGTVCIHQHVWGHRALKPTWLYIVPATWPTWSPGSSIPPHPCEGLSARARKETPAALAAELVRIARAAR